METNSASVLSAGLVGTKDAAQFLGVSRRQVGVLRAKEGLPWVKLGERVRFDLKDLREWLENQKRDGGTLERYQNTRERG